MLQIRCTATTIFLEFCVDLILVKKIAIHYYLGNCAFVLKYLKNKTVRLIIGNYYLGSE